METQESQNHESGLGQLIADYAEALASVGPPAPAESPLSVQQVLKVLRCRDRIQGAIAHPPEPEEECLAKLVDLDLKLKQNANLICAAADLEQLRQSLEPAESAWWWFLEPTATPSDAKPLSDKFDWLWNIGTVACLVIATSFISQTAKAFSAGGFDFLGTLTTISQGAGLAFIAGGALTDKGKRAVSQALTSIKVPDSLHAEVTFGASLVLLGAAYGLNENLHLVGDFYFNEGQKHEQKLEFSQAFKSYQRSLNFAPEDQKIQIAVGFLHENLGNFDEAIKFYEKGSAYGISDFLNAQARATLMRELQKNDWQGGIDEKIIRQAEDLLDRAERKTNDWNRSLGDINVNPRLSKDIKANRVIAKIARIKKDEKLTNETKNILDQSVELLLGLIDEPRNKKVTENTTPLTTASTLGQERVDCFYRAAFAISFLADLSHGSGIDYFQQGNEAIYACVPFTSFDPRRSSTPDAFLLRKNRFIGANFWSEIERIDFENPELIKLIYAAHYLYTPQKKSDLLNRITLIEDPKIWLALSRQVSKLVEKNFVQTSSEKKNKTVIWRLLLDQSGEIISYLAYDSLSREVAKEQPFLQEDLQKKVRKTLHSQLKAGAKLKFADFKLVLSPQGKVLHVLPWEVAYTELTGGRSDHFFIPSLVRSAFKEHRYTPNLNDPAELEALRSVVMENLNGWAIDNKKGIYYPEPALFKLKVSADGQVMGYNAVNAVARQKFGKGFPFLDAKLPELPERQTPPYAEFQLQSKGLFYQILPWDSKDQ